MNAPAQHAEKLAELHRRFIDAALGADPAALVPTPGLTPAARPIGDLLLDTIEPEQLASLIRSAALGADAALQARLLLSVLAQRFADEHVDYAVEATHEQRKAVAGAADPAAWGGDNGAKAIGDFFSNPCAATARRLFDGGAL
jgi:hypothetical protein